MNKLTAAQKQKLDQTAPEPNAAAAPIAPSSILQSAIDRQEKDLADLQTELDRLADDFATRAAAMVRQGLQDSYSRARQRIGAIDLSFFGTGEDLPPSMTSGRSSTIDIPSLPSIEATP